jgi:5-methylcytosine-specific restriction endonuclease McrA
MLEIKTPVADAAVDEYVARILAGGPLGKLLPAKPSDCDFTSDQRQKIRKANADKRALLKQKLKNGTAPITQLQIQQNGSSPTFPQPKMLKPLTKLGKMLYLQGGNCFFCGRGLKEEDASIEHLNPKSRGGASTEDNEVVCHKTLNQVFGDMDLKRKFEFVLKAKAAFSCPAT